LANSDGEFSEANDGTPAGFAKGPVAVLLLLTVPEVKQRSAAQFGAIQASVFCRAEF
jgi:hypothetical protein